MAEPRFHVTQRVRMSQTDAHYAGDLVDGARLLALFGDLATELLIRSDGEEGLLRAYETVEFLAPVYAGDFLELEAEIVHFGNTSRRMTFTARKVIEIDPKSTIPGKALVLENPIEVCRAAGTCVVSKKRI